MGENWVKKFRIVTISLIFSGALNIGLVAAFIAFLVQDRSSEFKLDGMPKRGSQREEKISNLALLETLSNRSFRELVSLLTNRELIEEGYAKRDLALAALVAQHHFHLEKALSDSNLQKRQIQLDPNRSIELYPGLTDEQFEAVIRFAYQERYPLTTQGLFALIKKMPIPRDESLEQAFLQSPELYALAVLFQKSDAPQEMSTLLALVSEGSWELLDRFAKEQAQMLDLSVEKRRRLLLSYLAHRSPTAAELLLKTDASFALKKLDDRGILDLLTLAQTKSEDVEKFCVSLLQSPRSDAVWRAAVAKLYAFAGEPLPEPFDLRAAASRFAAAPQPAPAPAPIAQAPKIATRYHVVQEGDSLWKIARQYKAKVDDIIKLNDLNKDRLYPGMTIQIPD